MKMKCIILFILLLFLFNPVRAQINWYSEPGNPVIENIMNTEKNATCPYILYKEAQAIFSLTYVGRGSDNIFRILTRNSSEIDTYPLSLEKVRFESSVIILGAFLIRNGNERILWYSVKDPAIDKFSIYLSVTTTDSDTFPEGLKILSPGPESFDSEGIQFPYIVNTSTNYNLYYSGNNGSNWNIYLATSEDDIVWNKIDSPILTPSQTWEGNRVKCSSVIYDGEVFEMWYEGVGGIGYARSGDGVNWEKYSGNPVFTGGSLEWEENGVAQPSVFYYDKNYYMFYSGSNGLRWKIGLASAADVFPPNTPALESLTPYEQAVMVRINNKIGKVKHLKQYNLYRKCEDEINYMCIGTILFEGVMEFFDQGLDYNKEYFYKVTALDEAGNESEYSNEMSIYPEPPEPPDTPILSWNFSSEMKQLQLIWTENAEPDFLECRLFFSEDGEVFNQIYSGVENEFIINIIENEYYWFYVIAVDELGNISEKSNVIKFINDTISPESPKVQKKIFKNYVQLVWNECSDIGEGILGYRIYRSTDKINYSKLKSVNTTKYLDYGIEQNYTYYYYVTSIDKSINCNESIRSNIIRAEIKEIVYDIEGILVYPNPLIGEGKVYIDNVYEGVSVKIYDINGKLIYSEVITNKKRRAWNPADQSDSPQGSGIYYLVLERNGKKSVRKICIIK
ncbi:MAG: T9SS type A sorting domain-containing protein [bacterium]|nr:T9SS type A sorting domain-containing protein [bacterium]